MYAYMYVHIYTYIYAFCILRMFECMNEQMNNEGLIQHDLGLNSLLFSQVMKMAIFVQNRCYEIMSPRFELRINSLKLWYSQRGFQLERLFI